MIGSLRGVLEEFEPVGDSAVEIVLDVGGVGYQVFVGSRHAASLATIGSEVHLTIHTHVREGAIALYGFATPLERRVFETLLGAHGVGPSLALAILSVYTPEHLAEVVSSADIAALTRVPGVGTKTAQRLIVDLGEGLARLAHAEITTTASTDPLARREAREALLTLGYGVDEVRSALDSLDEAGDTEQLLRAALRVLAPNR